MTYKLDEGVDGFLQPVSFALCAGNRCIGVCKSAFTPFTDQSYLCHCTEALIQQGIKKYADFKLCK